jgi:hypothetical protein
VGFPGYVPASPAEGIEDQFDPRFACNGGIEGSIRFKRSISLHDSSAVLISNYRKSCGSVGPTALARQGR